MADPVSILSSIAGIVSVTTKCSIAFTEFLTDVREAPRDILALHLELKATESVFLELQSTFTNRNWSNPPSDEWIADLDSILDRCMDIIIELSFMIKKLRSDTTSGWGSRTWRGIRWTFKEKDIRLFKERLESAKNTLGLKLQSLSTVVGMRVEGRVEAIHGGVDRMHSILRHLVAEQIVANEDASEKALLARRWGIPYGDLPSSSSLSQSDLYSFVSPAPPYPRTLLPPTISATSPSDETPASVSVNSNPHYDHQRTEVAPFSGSDVGIEGSSSGQSRDPQTDLPNLTTGNVVRPLEYDPPTGISGLYENIPTSTSPPSNSPFSINSGEPLSSSWLQPRASSESKGNIFSLALESGGSPFGSGASPFRLPITLTSTPPSAYAPYRRAIPSPALSYLWERRAIIVAIHFGITKSSIAFAFAAGEKVREGIVTKWPRRGLEKNRAWIPTSVAGDYQYPGSLQRDLSKWDWKQIETKNARYLPLYLARHTTNILLPFPPGKSAIGAIADYFSELHEAVCSALRGYLPEIFETEERNIRYVIAVPVTRLSAAVSGYRAAAIKAGLIRDDNDNRLTTIPYPEALILHCVNDGLVELDVHDVVLVVDCDQWTTDVTTHKVDSVAPLDISEFTPASDDWCGSGNVEMNFYGIIRAKFRKLGEIDSKVFGEIWDQSMFQFSSQIIKDFRNSGQNWAVEVREDLDYPDIGIADGYTTFTNDEVLRCYEPIVDRVIELIKIQQEAVLARGGALRYIFMTGELSVSEYLLQMIRSNVPLHLRNSIVRATAPVTDISKGALFAGLREMFTSEQKSTTP